MRKNGQLIRIILLLAIGPVSWIPTGCQVPNSPPVAEVPSAEVSTAHPPTVREPAASKPGPKPSEPKPPPLPGGLQLINTPVSVVLEIYRSLTGKELVVSPEAQNSTAQITVKGHDWINKPEAIALLEKTLREQAGIRISPINDSQLSVTAASSAP